MRFYGSDDEVHLPFSFFLAQVPSLNAGDFRTAVEEVERACGDRWPAIVLSNHDIDRACDRYDGVTDPDAAARLLAMLLLTVRGTPFIYYGEEIGMRTVAPARIEEVRDPVGRAFWPRHKGRDGARRPMQWDAGDSGGFTPGTPWLDLAPDATARNVASQRDEVRSIYSFYRSLLTLRRTSLALREGRYQTVRSHPDVFAFTREIGSDRLLVVLNTAGSRRPADLDRGPSEQPTWHVALGSHRRKGDGVTIETLRLEPFEALLLL